MYGSIQSDWISFENKTKGHYRRIGDMMEISLSASYEKAPDQTHLDFDIPKGYTHSEIVSEYTKVQYNPPTIFLGALIPECWTKTTTRKVKIVGWGCIKVISSKVESNIVLGQVEYKGVIVQIKEPGTYSATTEDGTIKVKKMD